MMLLSNWKSKQFYLMLLCGMSLFCNAQDYSSEYIPHYTDYYDVVGNHYNDTIQGPAKALFTDDLEAIVSKVIDTTDLKDYIYTLGTLKYYGREQGTKKDKETAKFIQKRFKDYNLTPLFEKGYQQAYSIKSEVFQEYQLNVRNQGFRFRDDFYAFTKSNREDTWYEVNDVLFLGYGIDDPKYSDYKRQKVEGKVILIYPGEPMKQDSTSYLTGRRDSLSSWSMNWRKKLEIAHSYGVKGVIFIERNHKFYIKRYRNFIDFAYFHNEAEGELSAKLAPSIYVSQELAGKIIGDNVKEFIKARNSITLNGKPKSLPIKTKIELNLVEKHKKLKGYNTGCFIEGDGSTDETILISTHHDHLGFTTQGLFAGADKNASGVASLIEIAQAYNILGQVGIKPKYNIALLSYSSGEENHYGLEYFLSSSAINTDKVVAHINLQALGGTDIRHEQNSPFYFYAPSNSVKLQQIFNAANEKFTRVQLDQLDSTQIYATNNTGYGYAKEKFPSILITTGEKDYNYTPKDKYKKVFYPNLAAITRLVFLSTYNFK